jgi:Bacterial DNA-binding protein
MVSHRGGRLDTPAGRVYAPRLDLIIARKDGAGDLPERSETEMTKAELVDHLAARLQLPKHQTATVVELFFQSIMA